MPTLPSSIVKDSGLSDGTGFFDANQSTLKHTKYENVFGLGDILNVPTTKTFMGGLSQVAVLRHNIERRLNGLSQNAQYDGYANAVLQLSSGAIASVEHKYNNAEVAFNPNPFTSALNKTLYSLTGKHQMENILKFKNWGPPYYKMKKTFQEESKSAASTPASLTP